MFTGIVEEKGKKQEDDKLINVPKNKEAAQKWADEIVSDGGVAKAYEANVLNKESLKACHELVTKDFGKTDILINGAGGNNPKASTTLFTLTI